MSWFILSVPVDPGEPFNAQYQPALETAFGTTFRIVCASILAYWVGDFVNSYVLARMKLWTGGRYLWTRTIGSTICGQGVDSLIFYPLAFYGSWSNELLISVMIANYCLKVGWEVVVTPVTYRVVDALKRAEGEDYFDRDTNFTPFSLSVQDRRGSDTARSPQA